MSAVVDRTVALARIGRLYPSVILHGGAEPERQAAALELARTLLCDRAEPTERPCGACKHCRRIVWPEGGEGLFHPDFLVLTRDLKTSTSADATRAWLRATHVAAFEARGQVFVVAAAETLSAEAGDSLLKAIEEPGLGNPRHFLLLAPSRLDLSATLRSRSLPIFLGPAEPPDRARVEEVAAGLGASLDRFAAGEGAHYLLDVAGRLAAAGDWTDPRAEAGWTLAASAVRTAALAPGRDEESRRRLLELAEALLVAPPWRLRGISAERILEGLASRHLAPLAPSTPRPTDAQRRSR